MPRWLKVAALVVAVVALLFVVMLLLVGGGGHRPQPHSLSGPGAGTSDPTSTP